MGVPIRHPGKGSVILNTWLAERQAQSAIAARQRAAMAGRREWWSGVAGMSSSGFAGAAINRLTASLAQSSNGVNLDLDGNLVILRSRARAICANNEFARRFLTMVATNIVGPTGPTLQVRAKTQQLALDKPANDAVEMAYARWSPQAELTGRMDLAHALRVCAKAVARDGEALIRFVRNRSLPMGLQIQILEADRLDESINRTLSGGAYIRQGVEFDGYGRPAAYWLKGKHPGDAWQPGNSAAERIDARDVLHVYLPERAEQVRGYTWFHAVLLRMGMLHGYEEAAVVAARVGASKIAAFQRKDIDVPSALAQIADGMDSAGRLQMSAEPGEMLELPPGYELTSWNPEYPHANFESFLKQCMRGVAAGLDVATHNLSGDMTDVNYSSARIAELSERDQWKVLQEWWNRSVQMPIYREWLASAMLRGEITFEQSGKALPADKIEKFITAARFQSRTWQWVDPKNEVEAVEKAIGLGLTSRTAVVASQGREIEDVIDELAQETAMLEDAGLPTTAGGTSKPAAPAQVPVDNTSKLLESTVALVAAAARSANDKPAGPVINVDARSTVNVPEREVHLEATVQPTPVTVEAPNVTVETRVDTPAPVVNVAPADVRVENRVEQPPVEVSVHLPERRSESQIERNAAGEIVRVTQVERDA